MPYVTEQMKEEGLEEYYEGRYLCRDCGEELASFGPLPAGDPRVGPGTYAYDDWAWGLREEHRERCSRFLPQI